jgi:ABC-type transporter Mla maintaining outer membrane lipid asymmetry ATPase subunit MlaF
VLRTSRVRHPGAGLDPGAVAQLDSLLATVLPGVDLTCPLSLEPF